MVRNGQQGLTKNDENMNEWERVGGRGEASQFQWSKQIRREAPRQAALFGFQCSEARFGMDFGRKNMAKCAEANDKMALWARMSESVIMRADELNCRRS